MIPLHTTKRSTLHRKTRTYEPPKPDNDILQKPTQAVTTENITITIPDFLEEDLLVQSSFSPPTAFEDLRDHEAVREQQMSLNSDRNNQRTLTQRKEVQQVQQVQIPAALEPIETRALKFHVKEVPVLTSRRGLLHDQLTTNVPKENHMLHRHINVIVFVPHLEGGVHKVSISISEKSTGNELISAALEAYTKQTGRTLNNQYTLRAAESDGTVDKDFPGMDKNSTVQKLGFNMFVLVLDKSSSQPTSPQQLSNHAFNKEDHVDAILRKKNQDVGRLFLEDVRLEVHSDVESVPSGIVPVAPDVLIKDLIKVVCQHYEIRDQDRHFLRLRMNDGRIVTFPDAVKYTTCKFLKHYKVLFSRVTRSNDARDVYSSSETKRRSESLMELLIPSNPINYREYKVVKINKYGRRQDRILGLDDEKLFNKLPNQHRNVTAFLGLSQTRTRVPERFASTLLDVYYDKKTPLKFATQFEDETLYWEALTVVEADEIVRTLRSLKRVADQKRKLEEGQKPDNGSGGKKLLSRLSARFLPSPFSPPSPSGEEGSQSGPVTFQHT
ncbi:hypothetical protein AKO1_001327 [Acrasis kona]|uniref:CRIM domain-containing protein n=1 Tax=Acrasis kona TaxID=1008807 RepID=A0AAW2ZE24_9EUKA